MVGFFVALLLGVAQIYFLNVVLKSAVGGKTKKMLIFIFLKIALYAAVIVPLMLCFESQIKGAAIGFAIGMPVAAITYTVITMNRQKKEKPKEGGDIVGHGEDN